MFPSPIGELHFSITQLRILCQCRTCFRPLSGSYISQFYKSMLAIGLAKMIVSVPYRGATFLNIKMNMHGPVT